MLLRNLLLSSLLLVTSTSCHQEHHKHEEKRTLPVTNPLKRDTDLPREYVAQIHAIQHIELRALEHGYVQEIYVDEGQLVPEGQRMFQIMPMLAQAELQRADAEASFAAIEFDNTKMLADKDIVSSNELKLSKARLLKAEAERSLAQAHRVLTEIRAPFSGIMGRFEVRTGSLVDEGELLTTMSDNSTVWVYFNVSEAEYLAYQERLKSNDPVAVHLRMADGRMFKHPGKIDTIEAEFNNETGNIAFRASFPNPEGLLRHGQTGKVVINSTVENAMVIPQKATFDVLDKKYVFVVDEQGTVHSRAITVSAELPHLYLVDNGLAEKDRILLEGLRVVNDGSVIDVDVQEPLAVLDNLELHAE